MSRKILVTFGDSCTYGDGLQDCLPPKMPNPSKFAWPTLLASQMDYDLVNLSKPGASNKLYRKLYIKIYKKCGDKGTTVGGDHGQETVGIAVPFFVNALKS